ncbi:DUF7680 family protein [Halosegnis rubeus]|nr:hypothetical protein [Halosegnis rubeus]
MAEGEAFAFNTGVYGDRPTFIMSRRRIDDRHEMTLYELSPTDVAEGRRTRFERAGRHNQVTTVPLDEAIVGEATPSELPGSGDEFGYDWSDWCAIKIATLRGDGFNEVSYLIESVFRELGVSSAIICTGEPASVSLPEAAGIQLSIAVRAMKPMRRRDCLREIAYGIDQMGLGECYYWHAKARSPTSKSGMKALRTLLAGHIE